MDVEIRWLGWRAFRLIGFFIKRITIWYSQNDQILSSLIQGEYVSTKVLLAPTEALDMMRLRVSQNPRLS